MVLGPILKVLALTYDRYISNWEKMRAYRAAMNVLEQNTEDAKRALGEVEQALAKRREELSGVAEQVWRKQGELKAASDELDTVLRVGNAGWQSGFVGGGSFPYSPGSEAYRRAEAKFQAVEKLKAMVLGRS